MNLLFLPDEILLQIATFLDQDSLISVALLNRRLRNVTAGLLRSMKVESFNENHLSYIITSGHALRALDFSDCRILPHRVSLAAIACSNLVQLNVANTLLAYPTLCEILGRLNRLEVLSCSLLEKVAFGYEVDEPTNARTFPSIKKLFIEVRPKTFSMEVVVDLVNRCISVEWMHVNVIGREETDNLETWSPMHRVFPGRLEALRTLVVSVLMSNSTQFVGSLIHTLLAAKIGPELGRRIHMWLCEWKECFIYENGYLNEERVESPPTDANVDLLRRVAHLHPQATGRITDPSNVPWGIPSELRLNNNSSELPRIDSILREITVWSTTLVELDFADCHDAVVEQDRLNFFTAFQSLEVLALPLCFLIEPTREPPSQELADAFHRLRLKKLFIVGNPQRKYFRKPCSRRVWLCEGCDNRVLDANFLDLKGLDALEELTLDGVMLRCYDKIVSSTARTIRLNLNCGSSLVNLNQLLIRCESLRKLKFTIADLDLNSAPLWSALAECKQLKQLCLGTYLPYLDGTVRIQRYLPEIVHDLESLHLHCPDGMSGEVVRDLFSLPMFTPYRERFAGSELAPMDSLPLFEPPLTTAGRGLCYSGSGIGCVKPPGWDV